MPHMTYCYETRRSPLPTRWSMARPRHLPARQTHLSRTLAMGAPGIGRSEKWICSLLESGVNGEKALHLRLPQWLLERAMKGWLLL